MRSHYDVLGVRVHATDAEVRRAYLDLARRHHPDRSGGDASAMRAVNAAYAVLADPVRRAEYDVATGLRRRATGDAPLDAEPTDDELADDRPYAGGVEAPAGWVAVAPAGLFFASIASFSVAAVAQLPALLVLGVVCFVMSSGLFLLAPLWAMTRGRPGRR